MRSVVTVTSAATTYALTALATLKEDLPGTKIPDATLSRWIHEASALAATYCGRVLAAEAVSEVFHLDYRARHVGSEALNLSRWPVSTITAVTEVDDDALDAAYYEVDAGPGLLYRMDGSGNATRWCVSRVTVEYTGGYSILSTLPRDIEAAVLMLCKRRAYTYTQDPNLRRLQVDGVGEREWWVSPTSADPMPAEVMALLNPYRAVMI